jgi:hypothetical protein
VLGGITGCGALAIAFWRHSIAWDPIMQMIGFPLLACAYACLIE